MIQHCYVNGHAKKDRESDYSVVCAMVSVLVKTAAIMLSDETGIITTVVWEEEGEFDMKLNCEQQHEAYCLTVSRYFLLGLKQIEQEFTHQLKVCISQGASNGT